MTIATRRTESPSPTAVTADQVKECWLDGVPIRDAEGHVIVRQADLDFGDSDIDYDDETGDPTDEMWPLITDQVNAWLMEDPGSDARYDTGSGDW